jgi:hypothetical protein
MDRYIAYSTLSKIGYIVRRCIAGHAMITIALAAPDSTVAIIYRIHVATQVHHIRPGSQAASSLILEYCFYWYCSALM